MSLWGDSGELGTPSEDQTKAGRPGPNLNRINMLHTRGHFSERETLSSSEAVGGSAYGVVATKQNHVVPVPPVDRYSHPRMAHVPALLGS